ncbi:MAG: hypothetical protein HYZ27_07780 [Deltaproteobacteria bacterium]|nr:hypothetical protein [Deltaproteobacteria bacterium]
MRRLLWLLAATGCGYTDSGSGSRTLEVEATLTYDENDGDTQADVRVKKEGQHLAGATVVFEDGEDGEQFELTDVGNRYRDTFGGYHRRMELIIEKGSDYLTAKLEGPGPFTLDEPKNTSIDLGDDVEVRWKTLDGIEADWVLIELKQGSYRKRGNDSSGKHVIPGDAFEASPDEEIQVTRAMEVNLEGGSAGSLLTSEYEVQKNVDVD